VLAISHLPVVAARAQQHLIAEKQVVTGRTSVRLTLADDIARRLELMRMVGGGGGVETAALVDRLLPHAARQKT
jgi:DNA repair ATPase RecN